MQTTAPERAAGASTTRPGAATPRRDLYSHIHKALRLFMTDTLTRVGRLDTGDAGEVAAVLAQTRELLGLCRSHLSHENEFVHSALEARRPGASNRIAGEHVEHLEAIAALEADVAALAAWPGDAAAQRLYRHLARFLAHNLEHMHVEETAHNAALWSLYTDAELADVEQRLVSCIGAAEMSLTLRWMVPALSPAERAAFLGEMQRQMPPEALRGVLDIVRPVLDDTAWGKLARALNVPIAPGLVQR